MTGNGPEIDPEVDPIFLPDKMWGTRTSIAVQAISKLDFDSICRKCVPTKVNSWILLCKMYSAFVEAALFASNIKAEAFVSGFKQFRIHLITSSGSNGFFSFSSDDPG